MIGVVIGRFQVAALHEGHIALLSEVSRRHPRLVVLVGTTQAQLNLNDPLPFFCRADAIRSVFPQATVQSLPDCQTDEAWSLLVDRALALMAPNGAGCTIYGGRENSLAHYSGQWPTKTLPLDVTRSGTDVRAATDLGYSFDFRQGMVYAAKVRHPTLYPTIDAVIQHASGETIVMIQKPGDTVWRLPGGFLDPAHDRTLESAVRREVVEECGIAITDPVYVGSSVVKDWRYRGSNEGILTSLFTAHILSGLLRPGDDASRAEWIPLMDVDHLVWPPHRPLINLWRGATKREPHVLA